MSNQKTEGTPRSESFFQSAARRPFFPEPGYYLPIIDEKLLELARLFATEEALALRIQDDNQGVDIDTIYEVVAMARRIATAGFYTTLVPINEMLDIAQIYCFRDPHAARVMQELVLENPRHPRFASRPTGTEFLNYAAELTTGPDTETAGGLLVSLLARFKTNDNPAWTARVAAALAYFSTR